jgi:hypothetical protein
MLSGYNKIFSARPVARHFRVFRKWWNKSSVDVGMKVGPPMEYYLRREFEESIINDQKRSRNIGLCLVFFELFCQYNTRVVEYRTE